MGRNKQMYPSSARLRLKIFVYDTCSTNDIWTMIGGFTFHSQDCCRRLSRFMPNICYAKCQLFSKFLRSDHHAHLLLPERTHSHQYHEVAAHCRVPIQLLWYRLYGVRVGSLLIIFNLLSCGNRTSERGPVCMREEWEGRCMSAG